MLKQMQYLLFIMLFACAFNLWSATTLISPSGEGGFENGATFTDNGWTVVNHTTNTWQIGSVAGSYAGTKSAFISNNGGTSYAYTTSSSQTSHFYKDITIPSGETSISLNFQWKGKGESGYDRLLVYTAPTSVTPVAGTPASTSTTLTGATLVYTQANYTQTSYTSASVTLSQSLAGSTVRLIFTWQNDGSMGTSPGVSVDNIQLTSSAPKPIMAVKGNNTTITNGDVTPGSEDYSDFGLVIQNGDITKVNTFTIANTGLAALNLTGTPVVSITGTNADDFSVTAVPTSPVAASTGTT